MDTLSAVIVQSSPSCKTYDCVELKIRITSLKSINPFTDLRISATFNAPDDKKFTVEGFCDSQDGTLFKVRYMPMVAGSHSYEVMINDSMKNSHSLKGTIQVQPQTHDGIVQVDPDHPWHYRYSGSGKHFFWNGMTTYYLMGWQDESDIHAIIDRLAASEINHIRVVLYGRQFDRPWRMPVVNTSGFSMMLNPWVAGFPDDTVNPNFDLTRFNVPYWQKFDRMVQYAATKNMQVSVIFLIGGQPLASPFEGYTEHEARYYRYAAARLAAYHNVMWDLANEGNFHRVPYVFWTSCLGDAMLKYDPYGHLLGAHNEHLMGHWNTVQLLQIWDAGLNKKCLDLRAAQQQHLRIIPQVIEESGYEDLWETKPGQHSTHTRRRVAWEITMAGCYSTAGETANRGTGVAPDTGGGWVNGRGDDTMILPALLLHLKKFFESFEWWKTTPCNELVTRYTPFTGTPLHYFYQNNNRADDLPAMVTGIEGALYVVYLPCGGSADVTIADGGYSIELFDPRTGVRSACGDFSGTQWSTQNHADSEDWVYLIRSKQ